MVKIHKIFRIQFIRLLFLFVGLIFISNPFVTFADELDDTRSQIEQKQQEATQKEQTLVQAKHYEGTLASQISQMSNDLYLARVNYYNAVAKVEEKERELIATATQINEKQEEIGYQTELIEARIRNLYKNSQYSPLEYLFLSEDFNDLNNQFVYRVNILRQDKEIIVELRDKVLALNDQKSKLEIEKEQLALDKASLETQKVQLEAQEAYLNSQIAAVRQQQNQLTAQLAGISNEIASLSAKEQSILAAKAAANKNTSTSVGSNPINATNEPQVLGDQAYWGFFIYGFPHRVGMNQYGAYGRAISGQSYQQILSAYYGGATLETTSISDGMIHVVGQSDSEGAYDSNGVYHWKYYDNYYNFEDYLKGISEMPVSWGNNGGFEALKAQAIAARTYALRSTNSLTNTICPSQSCHVFKEINMVGAEREIWYRALDETRGMVLKYGGNYIYAAYSSTAGGATISSLDSGYFSDPMPYTPGINDVDNQGNAYDGPSYANSPCYHTLNSCYEAFRRKALAQPWFTSEEMDLIINISRLDPNHRSEITSQFSHPYFYIDYTYQPIMPLRSYGDYRERMDALNNAVTDLLGQEGKAVFSGFSGAVTEVGDKHTGNITFSGNMTLTLDGQHVRTIFNIVAPANDEIVTTKFDIIRSN